MPFGLSRKDKSKDEDPNRSALFGSRSKSSSQKSSTSAATAAPQTTNPYAVQSGTPDPYAARPSQDPYAPRPSSGLNAPPSYSGGRAPSPLRAEKSPVPPGGYGGSGPPQQQQRYGGGGSSSSYGQQSGYGGNAYGSGSNEQPQQNRYGASGYGGLGRSNSQDTMGTDAGRAALFGDAPKRQAVQPSTDQSQQGGYGQEGGDNSYANAENSYGGYGSQAPDRELTQEEQEEEDVAAAKNEIKFIKQQDVSSTRNALRIAQQAEATGRETLARLGQQGERIHNTEKNLDMASNQNRLAEEKARELKTLNRSMFAVHVANPFTAKKREEAANAIALDKHQRERMLADETRANAYSSTARQQQTSRELGGAGRGGGDKASLAQRSKYQFEADSEDDEMENEIDGNLDAIHRGAKTLNQLGRAMGAELDEQNKHIDRIIGKTDKVDDEIAVNRARLNRIR